MSRGTDESGGGFLSRWSRLKQEAREAEETPKVETPEPEPEPLPLPPEPEDAAPPAVAEDVPPEEPPPPLELPDIDSLTRDSDYTGFLRAEVPAELRKAALRKLWRSDPVFANLDGLNDYDQNYAAPSIVGAAVRTAYDVIKGFTPPDMHAGDATAGAAEDLDPATQQNDAAPQYKTSRVKESADTSQAAVNAAAADPVKNGDEIGPLSDDDSRSA